MTKYLIVSILIGVTTGALAETNVTTKTVVRTYSGNSKLEERRVTHTVAGHESVKKRAERMFADADAALDLRDSRKGYTGGEWSESWREEAVSWLENQDFSVLSSAFEFVDSKGFRHLMAMASEPSRNDPESRRMAQVRAEMEAKIAISRAWDADVARSSEESKLEAESMRETVKVESVTSVGTHQGLTLVMSGMKEVDGEPCSVVVYGIDPKYMKFNGGR